ncbi:MAG: hypothetical protein IPN76_10175 [Saprospiraceae bacterium]|nr:hypothetical protein [Saprospiraceae bacterium]
MLDKMGMLENMKQRSKEEIGIWLKMAGKDPAYMPQYLAYGFIHDKVELERLLQFDDKGIPLGWVHATLTSHNPLMVSYFALVCWNDFIQLDAETSKNRFLEMANFLSEMGNLDEKGFWLPYFQSVPKFGLNSPWYSGLAHAVAMAVFIRSFDLTGDKKYQRIATQLCLTLTRPKAEGGFFETIHDGGSWIQEYPTDKIKQVLNGLLFCLIGLYEYQLKIGENPSTGKVLADCEATLFQRLPNYLVGPYTRYAFGRAAFSNIEYQGLFVFLFLHLHQLSGKHAYKMLAARFNKHTDWEAFFSFYEISDYKYRAATIKHTVCQRINE